MRMDLSSNHYNNSEEASDSKRMTLKPAHDAGPPEALIGPEIKRRLDKMGRTLKRQQIIGLIVLITCLVVFFGFVIYNQVQFE